MKKTHSHYGQRGLVTWPSFSLVLDAPPHCAMTAEGREIGAVTIDGALGPLGPYEARERLLNLQFSEDDQVLSWLIDVGYVRMKNDETYLNAARDIVTDGIVHLNAMQQPFSVPVNETRPWREDDINSDLIERLRQFRDCFQWLLSVSSDDFRTLLKNEGKPSSVRPPGIVDRYLLERIFLTFNKTRMQVMYPACFETSSPLMVTEATASPLDGIACSVYVDKHDRDQDRIYPACKNCGKSFSASRSDQYFCGSRCRNYFLTNVRRQKIRAAKLALDDWTSLTPEERKQSGDKWEWIAERAGEHSPTIVRLEMDADWVREQLADKKSQR